MQRGYVRLWRKSLDNGMIRNHELWSFWCWCLLNATYRNQTTMVCHQEIQLKPGDIIFGRRKAAQDLNLSERKIRTCLKSLKATNRITIKTTNKFSIVSVINWESYQFSETANDQHIDQQNDQPVTSKRPASDQPVTTNNNYIIKEFNKYNTPPYSPPPRGTVIYSDPFLKFWAAYPKKIGKGAAYSAWKRQVRNGDLTDILSAVDRQRESEQWQKDGGQFIPNPQTWLNQRRWEDEGVEVDDGLAMLRKKYGKTD